MSSKSNGGIVVKSGPADVTDPTHNCGSCTYFKPATGGLFSSYALGDGVNPNHLCTILGINISARDTCNIWAAHQ